MNGRPVFCDSQRQKAIACVHDTRTTGCLGRASVQPSSPGPNLMKSPFSQRLSCAGSNSGELLVRHLTAAHPERPVDLHPARGTLVRLAVLLAHHELARGDPHQLQADSAATTESTAKRAAARFRPAVHGTSRAGLTRWGGAIDRRQSRPRQARSAGWRGSRSPAWPWRGCHTGCHRHGAGGEQGEAGRRRRGRRGVGAESSGGSSIPA